MSAFGELVSLSKEANDDTVLTRLSKGYTLRLANERRETNVAFEAYTKRNFIRRAFFHKENIYDPKSTYSYSFSDLSLLLASVGSDGRRID
jgi:hypothetical protein